MEVACESCCKDNMVMVFGEITTKAPLDYDKIVRETCQGIGYDTFDDDLASAHIFDASGVFTCIHVYSSVCVIVVEACCAKRGAGPKDGRRE